MYSTEYVKAADVADAAAKLAAADDGKFLAGGHDLTANLKTATGQPGQV